VSFLEPDMQIPVEFVQMAGGQCSFSRICWDHYTRRRRVQLAWGVETLDAVAQLLPISIYAN
jgi:hypothetical protein